MESKQYFVRWKSEQQVITIAGTAPSSQDPQVSDQRLGPFRTFKQAEAQAVNVSQSPFNSQIQIVEMQESKVWDVEPLPKIKLTEVS